MQTPMVVPPASTTVTPQPPQHSNWVHGDGRGLLATASPMAQTPRHSHHGADDAIVV
ncbi:MAG: hypothetical protein FWC32_00465 [Firmicutes bacterium]|nr:hypothetical protein [Bacillota bacterium]